MGAVGLCLTRISMMRGCWGKRRGDGAHFVRDEGYGRAVDGDGGAPVGSSPPVRAGGGLFL
jgi:hypothetical protein